MLQALGSITWLTTTKTAPHLWNSLRFRIGSSRSRPPGHHRLTRERSSGTPSRESFVFGRSFHQRPSKMRSHHAWESTAERSVESAVRQNAFHERVNLIPDYVDHAKVYCRFWYQIVHNTLPDRTRLSCPLNHKVAVPGSMKRGQRANYFRFV